MSGASKEKIILVQDDFYFSIFWSAIILVWKDYFVGDSKKIRTASFTRISSRSASGYAEKSFLNPL